MPFGSHREKRLPVGFVLEKEVVPRCVGGTLEAERFVRVCRAVKSPSKRYALPGYLVSRRTENEVTASSCVTDAELCSMVVLP
jgi:hypothetical protein